MAKNTLIIMGPGGVGKSPIDNLIRTDVIRLDPYRLRDDGPRDAADRLYAPVKLRDEITSVFHTLGDTEIVKKAIDETIEWYPRAMTAFFTVRGEWQCVIVPSDTGRQAKMEVYAPVLPTLMNIREFTTALGTAKILVLNPAPESLLSMSDWSAIEERTRYNCRKRGDSEKSIQKRVASVAVEAPYWRQLIVDHGALEAVDWKFPEYVYKENPHAPVKAKASLLGLDRTLGDFF